MAKHKRPTWKDSKYADAKGKFKSLSPTSLATWLIKSRRGNKRAIIGSLNQQIAFNKYRPSYVAKMKATRNIVTKRLKKKK